MGAALDELDLSAALAAFREQESHGHTAESDGEIPIGVFANKAARFSLELGDVLRDGDRQNLDVAYRRAARLAAFGLSIQRRIRREQQSKRSTD